MSACSDDGGEQVAATTTASTAVPTTTLPPPTPACLSEEVVVVAGPEVETGLSATAPLVVQNASPLVCTVPPYVGVKLVEPTVPDQALVVGWQSPADGAALPAVLELAPCATASTILQYARRGATDGTAEGLAFGQLLIALSPDDLPRPVAVNGGALHVHGPTVVEPPLVVDEGEPPTQVPACSVPAPPPASGEII